MLPIHRVAALSQNTSFLAPSSHDPGVLLTAFGNFFSGSMRKRRQTGQESRGILQRPAGGCHWHSITGVCDDRRKGFPSIYQTLPLPVLARPPTSGKGNGRSTVLAPVQQPTPPPVAAMRSPQLRLPSSQRLVLAGLTLKLGFFDPWLFCLQLGCWVMIVGIFLVATGVITLKIRIKPERAGPIRH